jgi:lipopolysaccharide export system permease protein
LETWVIIQLISFNLAWMLVLAIPMGVLFSTLLSYGSMSASYEIAIIKSGGASLYRMMSPVLIMSLILSYGLFVFNDIILPEANHKSKVLLTDIKRTKPTFALTSGLFSHDLPSITILSRKVDSINGKLYNVTIYDNSKSRSLNIVSADSGEVKFKNNYTKIQLDLHSGEIHQMINGSVQNYKKIDFENYQFNMDADGFGFQESAEGVISRGQRELTIAQMREMQKKVNDAVTTSENRMSIFIGDFDTSFKKLVKKNYYKNNFKNEDKFYIGTTQSYADTAKNRQAILQRIRKKIDIAAASIRGEMYTYKDNKLEVDQYEVEIQKKYAIPFACFIFALVGCPLGIKTKGGNFGISAGLTLFFYIIYWVCLIGGEKLADRGLLSPFLSMWMGNIIVGVIGIVLILVTNNETFSLPKFDWFKKNLLRSKK